MKNPIWAVWGILAAICCGCVSHKEPAYRAGDERPPAFLTGAASTVLTNYSGFSAHVVATTSSIEHPRPPKQGEILERDGMLIYQPAVKLKGKRARRQGGLLFIWDENKGSGYVISEALQGYAPFLGDPETAPRGPAILSREGVVSEINGHPCHRYEAIVPLANGADSRLVLWQADDARHFPVRIEWSGGDGTTTLNFSEIRMTEPARELFAPPGGFTAYASPVSLMNELIVREASVNKQSAEFDEPADVRSSNWHSIGTP